ncbi:MAG: response regulator [Lentisphaerae bacterium]|jgi:CheY-like chemotaxis protein|nr:response regulator [Lentisphaerota bacterium]MBT4816337.1 response regulator [Lentisphaerota bacterium]MBT5608848.1 response regulator [Lentisphaerota bacterium]MBT7058738.1 response regulator [Lentisphaerota bacterium]MBT7845055.1 response regulator [Lentisphaerota bacterium]
MRLLIVDDREENRYFLEMLLQGHGHEVISAVDGVQALELARRAPPGIIISDILMPGMDGFALCREWKKDPALRGIPFIFYTATYTEPKDQELALSLGAERFMVKPAEPEAFIKMLNEVIGQCTSGSLKATQAPIEGEEEQLRQYNEVLVRKLEDKMKQLEETNRLLELELAKRMRVERELRAALQQLGGADDHA